MPSFNIIFFRLSFSVEKGRSIGAKPFDHSKRQRPRLFRSNRIWSQESISSHDQIRNLSNSQKSFQKLWKISDFNNCKGTYILTLYVWEAKNAPCSVSLHIRSAYTDGCVHLKKIIYAILCLRINSDFNVFCFFISQTLKPKRDFISLPFAVLSFNGLLVQWSRGPETPKWFARSIQKRK